LSPISACPIIRISDVGLLIRILAHLHHLLHWRAGGGVPALAHQYLLAEVEIGKFWKSKNFYKVENKIFVSLVESGGGIF
jgi:hypothetical protein